MTTANFPVNGPVVLDVVGTELTEDDVRRIRHPLTGMVILFTRNYESPAQLSALTAAVHAVKPGVLIGVDHEGGRVQRFRSGFTEIPAMHAYGDLWQKNPQAAARALTAAGFVMAAELLACGVDFTFAPVLDLDWGHSAIIGERSFSRYPAAVAAMARAVTYGMMAAGMANCGKHFPGHGWAEADSHKALPEDERSPETILAEDTEPYAWLGAGLVSVMTAHVLYPKWDTVPATFSRRILQDGLRKRLGFEGLIFSDDLSMQGAKKEGGVVERAQKALAAGCDALIICNNPAETDELLQGLKWQTTEAFAERWRRLVPRPTVGDRKNLENSALYRRSLVDMKLS